MAQAERLREEIETPPSAEEIARRAANGWRLAAVEWVRDLPATTSADASAERDTPYGLRAAAGSTTLVEDPDELKALRLMLRLVIDDDNTLAEVANTLNDEGFRTRDGQPWSQSAVFEMLPRLVDEAPGIYARPDWSR